MTETGELIRQISSLPYIGVFVVALLANAVIPVPEEAVLLILGYVAGADNPVLNGFLMVPVAIAGLISSDLIMYGLSRNGNRIVRFFYAKFFEKRIEKRREWVEHHITKVIFLSRFMIQLRFIGPFLAGQFKIKVGKFLWYDFLALIIYVPIYIFLGWYFRDQVDSIIQDFSTVKNIILVLASVTALVLAGKYIARTILKPKNN